MRRWAAIRRESTDAYAWLTGNEVARELARIDLPLSTYTQWYWKIDLHNLLHFLTLRVDAHAQWEIQEFGRVMAGMLKRVAPLSYEAWIDYDVCGTHLSRGELDVAARAGQRRERRPRLGGGRARSRGARRAEPLQARDRRALRQAGAAAGRPRLRARPGERAPRRALRRALRRGRPRVSDRAPDRVDFSFPGEGLATDQA